MRRLVAPSVYAEMPKVLFGLTALGLTEVVICFLAPVQAQSFDCGKASTPVARLICTDTTLAELDLSLASELRSAIAAYPERRTELISEERRWLVDRDDRCVVKTGDATEVMPKCVDAQYRQRIADLKAFVAKHGADVAEAAATGGCKTVVDRYRALASANLGQSPLNALAASPTSGITVSEPLERAPGDLAVWAAMQDPPFKVDDDVQEAWNEKEGTSGVWELSRLPDTDFYSLSSVQGTAHCINSLYFEVKNGRAHLASAPPGFEDEGGASCGVGRAYGHMDQRPAFFQELYDYTPNMTSTLTVARWENGGFVPGCTVRFSFAPAFGGETLNLHKESCDGPNCEGLRRAAFKLVEAAQKDPRNAKANPFASLTPGQKTEYETAERLAGADAAVVEPDPAAITEQAPLRVPYVSERHVYVVSLGHFTLGWRYFSDWSVTFEALENGKLVPRAAFAVAMRKGRLEEVIVTPISPQGTP